MTGTPPPLDGSGAGPLVYKFGGSSLADADRIAHVAKLIAAAPSPPVVVVSAVAGVTDRLAELVLARTRGESAASGPLAAGLSSLRERHRTLARSLAAGSDADPLLERVDAIFDAVLSDLDGLDAGRGTGLDAGRGTGLDGGAGADRIRALGEDLSVELVVHALHRLGREARAVDARTVVRTDGAFGSARPNVDAIAEAAESWLRPVVAHGEIAVMQGFVGADAQGRTTTLGRGGSDYTAALVGAALDARAVHIWTDVDGVLSGDPRAVEAPRTLERLGFQEAVELAHFGARVLHPGAAKYAVSRGVPVRIRSTFAPERAGTLVLDDRWGPPEIAAVAFKPGVALIQVRSHPSALPYGFLARVFGVLARHELPVDLVATSHTSTAFTLDADADVSGAARELGHFADVTVRTGLATVTVVGHGLLEEPGIGARVFQVVNRNRVHLVSQASNVSLSFVVDEDSAPELVRRLHRTLIGARPAEVTT
ncbi:MAG: aspartate kinase [Gemmatimonadetes bacterium]|nr:aspartate kinase [Gemmatimonadota bacterium]NNF38767.1 aspartate kinase [Gemmatimonadota bacterium]